MCAVTKITQPYKRQDGVLTILLSLAVLVPLGMAGIVISLLFLPWGLLGLPVAFVAMSAGFVPLIKTAMCACPHCGSQIRVTQKAKVFRCKVCGRRISKIGERLEAI